MFNGLQYDGFFVPKQGDTVVVVAIFFDFDDDGMFIFKITQTVALAPKH